MRALLALLLILLCAGCKHGGGGWTVARFSNVSGTATVNGPLPTYEHYDGFNPLQSDVRLALLQSGTGRMLMSYGIVAYPNWGGNPSGIDTNFNFELSEFLFDEGDYDLVWMTPHEWALSGWDDNSPGEFDVLKLESMQHIGYAQEISGLDAELFTTGDGPYATVHGELRVNGNLKDTDLFQVVLKPLHPRAGVAADAGFIWTATPDPAQLDLGRVEYAVPFVSYDTYTLSYSGNGVRSAADPLDVEERMTVVDQPLEDAGAFSVTTTWQERPYALGEINGTLAGPVTEGVFLRATRTNAGDPPEGSENYRRAFWHYVSSLDHRDYKLGWLIPGEYEVELVTEDGVVISTAYANITAEQPVVTALTVTSP